jgi:hypothetical protein
MSMGVDIGYGSSLGEGIYLMEMKRVFKRTDELEKQNRVQIRYIEKDSRIHNKFEEYNKGRAEEDDGTIRYIIGEDKESEVYYRVCLDDPKKSTFLNLEMELNKLYGEPEKRNGFLEYKEMGIRLIPETLGIDFSYSKGEKIPKNIERLITKLQTLNE